MEMTKDKDQDNVWAVLDGWIEKEVKPCEAMSSAWDTESTIRISYARITNNKLIEHGFVIKMELLKLLDSETTIVIMNDILSKFRSEKK